LTEIDQIKKILEKHEKRISELEKSFKLNPIPTISGEEVVVNLINSGFFDTLKKYGELRQELKKQAKFDKKHNYKIILEKFTNENKLKRKMVNHQWVYSKT